MTSVYRFSRWLAMLLVVLIPSFAWAASPCEDFTAEPSEDDITVVRALQGAPAVVSILHAEPGDLVYVKGVLCGPDRERLSEVDLEAWRFTSQVPRPVSLDDLLSPTEDLTVLGPSWEVPVSARGRFFVFNVPATGPERMRMRLAFEVDWSALPEGTPYVIFNFETVKLASAQATLAAVEQ